MPIAAIAMVAGTVASSAIGASAAGNAASTQANAALQAANLQHQDAQAALGFNQNVFNTQQAELQPWLQTGQGAQANLAYLMGVPVTGNAYTPGAAGTVNAAGIGAGGQVLPGGVTAGTAGRGTPLSSLINPSLGAQGSLAQPFGEKFVAPTDVTQQNDPGYQFRLQQGQQALERSAASSGNLLSGGTAKALDRYAQDYASSEYGNVYNRAFNEYATRYNQYQQGQANLYNRLAGLSGAGQQAAGQLGYLGQGAANNISNVLMSSGQQIGNQLNNAGAARASGYIGGANAISGGLNNLSGLAMLYGMGAFGGGGGGLAYPGGLATVPGFSSPTGSLASTPNWLG